MTFFTFRPPWTATTSPVAGGRRLKFGPMFGEKGVLRENFRFYFGNEKENEISKKKTDFYKPSKRRLLGPAIIALKWRRFALRIRALIGPTLRIGAFSLNELFTTLVLPRFYFLIYSFFIFIFLKKFGH